MNSFSSRCTRLPAELAAIELGAKCTEFAFMIELLTLPAGLVFFKTFLPLGLVALLVLVTTLSAAGLCLVNKLFELHVVEHLLFGQLRVKVRSVHHFLDHEFMVALWEQTCVMWTALHD